MALAIYFARNLTAADVSDVTPLSGGCSGFRILNRSGADVVLKAISKNGGTFTMTFPTSTTETVDIALKQILATGSSNLTAASVEIVLRGSGL